MTVRLTATDYLWAAGITFGVIGCACVSLPLAFIFLAAACFVAAFLRMLAPRSDA